VIALGIETATSSVGVALCGDDGVLGSIEVYQGRRHAEALAPAIAFLCEHAATPLDRIGVIGVDVGPGLFTGMRVGIATANSLAMALDVPVVGVSSLDLLAHAHRATEQVVAAVVDARKGEVFYALYVAAAGVVQQVTTPRAGTIEDVRADVMARGQATVAVGDGAQRYREQLGAVMTVAGATAGLAVELAALARTRALSDGDLSAGSPVVPVYLREPDATINWTHR
jgi:tRNA threonylcarbamoyladenosine biosynthesis protein TsaB